MWLVKEKQQAASHQEIEKVTDEPENLLNIFQKQNNNERRCLLL